MTDKEQLSSPEDSVQSDLTESTVVRLSERVEQLEQQLNNVLLLLSDVYRYGKLRDLLAAQQWKEADLETTKVMLEIAGQSNHDNITPEDVIQFPCSSLRLLDKLWRQYSGDRFGFSLQQQIYVSAGGTDYISNIDLAIL